MSDIDIIITDILEARPESDRMLRIRTAWRHAAAWGTILWLFPDE